MCWQDLLSHLVMIENKKRWLKQLGTTSTGKTYRDYSQGTTYFINYLKRPLEVGPRAAIICVISVSVIKSTCIFFSNHCHQCGKYSKSDDITSTQYSLYSFCFENVPLARGNDSVAAFDMTMRKWLCIFGREKKLWFIPIHKVDIVYVIDSKIRLFFR